MSKPDEEFFIGYAPPMPRGILRFVRRVIIGLSSALVIWAAVLTTGHVALEGGAFEFGHPAPFAGTIVERPYPALRLEGVDPNVTPSPLLVAPGKHGADAIVAGLNGRRVTLIATRIQRGPHTMIQIEPASLVVRQGLSMTGRPVTSLGQFADTRIDVTGEVVDSKCFLGVMVPGSGKTHKECASLCLRGGIPPALYVQDRSGRSALLLLTGPSGAPVGARALYVAGEVIRVTGSIRLENAWQVLQSDPVTWEALDR
jgi:hypothetical protein